MCWSFCMCSLLQQKVNLIQMCVCIGCGVNPAGEGFVHGKVQWNVRQEGEMGSHCEIIGESAAASLTDCLMLKMIPRQNRKGQFLILETNIHNYSFYSLHWTILMIAFCFKWMMGSWWSSSGKRWCESVFDDLVNQIHPPGPRMVANSQGKPTAGQR